MRSKFQFAVLTGFIEMVVSATAFAEKTVFQAPGRNFGVWQLTFDPTVRDWANYHNTRCFSPDGRYVCYSHWPAGSKSQATVHLFDLHTETGRQVGQGIEPRWARHHNWLFFVSGIYDADPKGSPDGTKICFVSNYPYPGSATIGTLMRACPSGMWWRVAAST